MKTTVLAILVLALSIASNAHALTYNQTYTYSPPFALNNGNNNQTTSFTFTGVTDPFVAGQNSPSLSLDLTGSTGFSDQLNIVLSVGSTYLTTLTSDHPTVYFTTPELLSTLNQAIINQQVTFDVSWIWRDGAYGSSNGSSKLSSATLNGNLAPEPASALLVAAGLASLPFLRRFRKRHS